MVVREMTPGVTVIRVVLSDGRPLALCNVWAPFLPVFFPFAVLLQTLFFLAQVFVIVDNHHFGGP